MGFANTVLLIYLAPSILALGTFNPNSLWIIFINLTLGWTGGGWIASLLLALFYRWTED